MNVRVIIPLIALFAAVVLFSMQGDSATGQSKASDESASAIGRFQVSAFGPTPNRAGPGYYVIDTATGELWSNFGDDNKPIRLSGPLLK